MAPSKSLLAMAAFSPVTCAIEVSMLRGGIGNDLALRRLQEIAVNNDGRIHWGQQNDLSGLEVAAMYGERYLRWCESLQAIEGASPTFSNPFSKSHGLEPETIAPPPRRLDVSVIPPSISFGLPVTVTVRAEDAENGADVPGTVTIANFAAGIPDVFVSEHPTNAAFTLTFEAGASEFDLDTHTGSAENPSGTVTADGYEPAIVPFAFR